MMNGCIMLPVHLRNISGQSNFGHWNISQDYVNPVQLGMAWIPGNDPCQIKKSLVCKKEFSFVNGLI